FGLLFAAVGGLIIYGGIWSGRLSRREKAARAAHPNEPWLWNRAWTAATLHDSSNVAAIGSWIIAIIWNAIAWPAAFAVLHPAPPPPPPPAPRVAPHVMPLAPSRNAPRAAPRTASRPASRAPTPTTPPPRAQVRTATPA